MSTIVKATTAADFLGFVPTLLGYTPTESLVLIPFAGPRTMGAMRMDLPDVRTTEFREGASTMIGMVCKLPDVDGVAVIGYSTTQDHHHIEPLMNAVMARADQCGLRLVDALYVTSDGWGSFAEGVAPRPLTDLTTTTVDGVSPPAAGNQASGTDLPLLSEDLLRDVAQAISTFEPEYMSQITELYEALLDTPVADLTGEMVAFLCFALDRPALRDIFIVQVTRGKAAGELALEAQLAWEEGVEYPAELAKVMWGEGPRPDPARLEKALELARIAAAAIILPGAFATCAWLAWALGRSTHADRYAQKGLSYEAGHGLCEIIASFVHAGHLPAWAFTPRNGR